MEYTKEQIDAVVNVTGAELFINHVIGNVYCEAVAVGMMFSHDSDGLTEEDIKAIQNLLP
mgnify:CR=1 FL=1